MAPALSPTNGNGNGAIAPEQLQAKTPQQNETISWNERPTPDHHVPNLYPSQALPKSEASKHHAPEHKRYQDVLAYEDKWLGWDGPVWCSRYGRFENQEDAAADDGYKIKGGVPHEELELEHCQKHGCSCRVPFQHRSYVRDIQRRVEPMVESLVRLETQVGKLVHHLVKDGESFAHTGHGARGDPDAMRFDETTNPNRFQRPLEPAEDSLAKLEARVEGLMHQVQHIMKNHNDRFEKYGENLVPPPREHETKHEAKHITPPNEAGYDTDPRQFFAGGR